MREFSVFIDCVPPTTTNQSQRGLYVGRDGRPRVFMKAKGRSVENDLCALLAANKPPADFPRDLPVRAEIALFFPYRKTEKKRVVRGKSLVPHSTKPDVDNLVKFILDCMTRTRFWNDDSQVYDLRLKKFYAGAPGIGIKLFVGAGTASEAEAQKQQELF